VSWRPITHYIYGFSSKAAQNQLKGRKQNKSLKSFSISTFFWFEIILKGKLFFRVQLVNPLAERFPAPASKSSKQKWFQVSNFQLK
jgi:hypothetical protein